MLSIITKLIIGLAGLSYWHLRFDLDKSGYSLGCGGSVAHSRQKQVPRCDGHDKTTGLNHRPFQVDNSSKVAFSAVVSQNPVFRAVREVRIVGSLGSQLPPVQSSGVGLFFPRLLRNELQVLSRQIAIGYDHSQRAILIAAHNGV